MPSNNDKSAPAIALVGNPNTGKSTLFGALVGVRQRVGNYPGVTVEKNVGRMMHAGRSWDVIDLPGLYSLSPRSKDEAVAVDVLLGSLEDTPSIEAVICIADACNLGRNLYLLGQVVDLGLPTVLAVNMIDVAERRGISIDLAGLEQRLGIPVVATQATRGEGCEVLKETLERLVGMEASAASSPREAILPEALRLEAEALTEVLADRVSIGSSVRPTGLAERLLLDVGGTLTETIVHNDDQRTLGAIAAARSRLIEAGSSIPECETTNRHAWVARKLEGLVVDGRPDRVSRSDRIDRVLTHRFWGTLIFLLVMLGVFEAVFAGAEPISAGIDAGLEVVGRVIGGWMDDGPLRSLLIGGVLHGVGGVLTFLPQILILFAFIGLLEDFGYMARAAFLMDRWMSRVGLCGKAFIPLLSSFACAVPGIMATRVIENPRERLVTILVAPLMTCSARLPIYALLVAAFIPSRSYLGGMVSLHALTLGGLYLLGIVSAVIVAFVLKRTLLRGDPPTFVMELPSYQLPSLGNVLHRIGQRGLVFLRTAGTVILAVSVIVWAASYYPRDAETVEGPHRARIAQLNAELASSATDDARQQAAADELAEIDYQILGEYQRQSYLGRAGRSIEPVFRPLGWDWRIGSAVIASFPAREIVVATLGVLYDVGDENHPAGSTGESRIAGRLHAARWEGTDRPVFNVPVALSLMVFYALCAQCAATLAVMRRETGGWRWPAFTFVYMTTMAYVGAFVTYRIGMWIGG